MGMEIWVKFQRITGVALNRSKLITGGTLPKQVQTHLRYVPRYLASLTYLGLPVPRTTNSRGREIFQLTISSAAAPEALRLKFWLKVVPAAQVTPDSLSSSSPSLSTSCPSAIMERASAADRSRRATPETPLRWRYLVLFGRSQVCFSKLLPHPAWQPGPQIHP